MKIANSTENNNYSIYFLDKNSCLSTIINVEAIIRLHNSFIQEKAIEMTKPNNLGYKLSDA